MAGTSARSKASSPRPAMTAYRKVVMPGLVPGIHVLLRRAREDVDGRDVGAKQSFVASPGHDGL